MADNSTPITPAILDQKALTMLFELFQNSDAVDEIIDEFLAESAQSISKFESWLEQHDVEQLRFAAHSLKGNSLSYGATALSKICKSIEENVRMGQFDTIRDQIKDLQAEFLKVELALRTEQAKNK